MHATKRLLLIVLAAVAVAVFIPSQSVMGKTSILKALENGDKEKGQAQTEPSAAATPAKPTGTAHAHNDAYARETPRGTVQGFMEAGRQGDFKKAAKYLALDGVRMADGATPEDLAEKLYRVLRRGMWIDFNTLSGEDAGFDDDGLSQYLERLGFLDLPDEPFQVLLERTRNKQGVRVWVFSRSTAKAVPKLYDNYRLGPIAELLSELLPRLHILGIELWEWLGLLLLGLVSYLLAWIILSVLKLIMAQRWARVKEDVQKLYGHPLRWLLAIIIMRLAINRIGLSLEVKHLFNAKTLLVVVGAWLALSLTGMVHRRLIKKLTQQGRNETTILLRPLSTIIKVLIIIVSFLLWLDNIGFNVTALLASLGVGGIAVGLAAQDTLKNFIGSIAVLLDKPYQVGERIRLKGHDGIVQEVGLRSTRMLGVDGNEVTIPNETMARNDIVNVTRRPHIRRIFNLHVAYDTPAEKLRQAVKALEGLLENHEGMDPELPPRVYLNEFGESTLNIEVWFWYHPPNFWDYKTFSQELNLRIKEILEDMGVAFAFPVRTVRFKRDPEGASFAFGDDDQAGT